MINKTNNACQSKSGHRLLITGSSCDFEMLIKKSMDRGYYTVVCDGYPNNKAKKSADKSYQIDVRDVNSIAKLCVDEQIDGIIGSFSDLLFEQITKIADIAGLRWYAKPEKLKYYREKPIAKALLRKLGISVPRSAVLTKNFSSEEVASFSFPVVVKPIDGYGSKGILVADSIEEIKSNFDFVAQCGAFEKSSIAIEEFIDAPEYNFTCWVSNGHVYPLALADREKNPREKGKIPLLNRVVYPAKDLSVQEKAREVLQKFADYVGQKEGPLSMQFFEKNNDVIVCEIAGRIFGYEHELVCMTGGLEIEELLLDYVYEPEFLDNRLRNFEQSFIGCATGLYFLGKEGIIKDISVADDLGKHENVVGYNMFYESGEAIKQFDGKPYLARYYLYAGSREQIDSLTDYFFENMHVYSNNAEDLCIRHKRSK